eukprot:85451-Hanusia_phi.AAC.1
MFADRGSLTQWGGVAARKRGGGVVMFSEGHFGGSSSSSGFDDSKSGAVKLGTIRRVAMWLELSPEHNMIYQPTQIIIVKTTRVQLAMMLERTRVTVETRYGRPTAHQSVLFQ